MIIITAAERERTLGVCKVETRLLLYTHCEAPAVQKAIFKTISITLSIVL